MSDNNSDNNSDNLSKNVYISASQLYIITGLDRFGKLCPLLIKYWEKINAKDYYKYVYDIQDIYSIEHLDETFYETVQRLSKKNNLDIMKQVQECLKSKNASNMIKVRSNIINKIEKAKINKEDKNLLLKNVKNLTNTNYGTVQEGNVIDNYCKMLDVSVQNKQKFIERTAYWNSVISRDYIQYHILQAEAYIFEIINLI